MRPTGWIDLLYVLKSDIIEEDQQLKFVVNSVIKLELITKISYIINFLKGEE